MSENQPAPWWKDLPEEIKPIKNDNEIAKKKFKQAKEKYEAMTSVYEQKKLAEHNGKWMRSLITTGTYNDKIKALALIVSSGPFNTYNYLVQLLGHCTKKNRDEAELAIRATKELFQQHLLPKRCLLNFQQQNFEIATPYILSKYYFEHLLKNSYAQFLEILKNASMGNVNKFKLTAIRCASELAASCPEQRYKAISLVVNKLGDLNGKVANKTDFYIQELLKRYKDTTEDIINAIRELIIRPNVNQITIRRGLTSLKNIQYSKNNPEQAEAMIKLLIVYFKSLYNQKEIDTRALQNVIIGMRKCINCCKNFKEIEEHLTDLYKIARTIPFTRALECVSLLNEIDRSKRCNRLIYEKVNEITELPSEKQFIFLNILRNNLLKEESIDVIASFIKKLLIKSLYSSPSFICSVLGIVSNMLIKYPILKGLFDNGELLDDDEEHYHDIDIDDSGNQIIKNEGEKSQHEFDWNKRDPAYTGAINTKCFEINFLLHHYHPTVRQLTQSLINGTPIHVNLELWESLSSKLLLDRFALKKLIKDQPHEEEEQTNDGHISFDKKTVNKTKDEKNDPRKMIVNSEEFIELKRDKIPSELLFFFDYYIDKHVEKGVAENKPTNNTQEEHDDDSDGMSEDLEEDDDIIYNGKVYVKKEEEPEEGNLEEIEFNVSKENINNEEKSEEDEYDYEDIMDHETNELLGLDDDQIDEGDMSIEEGNVIDEEDDVD
ncbi:hypothetical protein ENUP19_0161G0030 [Entamoeba nuttalli]|uniref:Ccaat-box-binding transcription factor, putative n=2 Tax=Entamoeba nuttalli TaxID=412467 RepID=K2GW22_ENTNP|nr:ccaat-box-binding transcription factor, putative [Entamoeba nuttalli P19]EKE38012.1 ccaat-box-binding transcription factor, putative [Entamoeba nuttalli P19]|eukprot:XP_008859665.1 ccaat-box-binding transcription factor, putative [Entamoeba nuttalli P19]